MTLAEAGPFGALDLTCLPPPLRRLAGDLIEACVVRPTQPCPGQLVVPSRRRLGDGMGCGNRCRHPPGRACRGRVGRARPRARQSQIRACGGGYARLWQWAAAFEGEPAFSVEGSGNDGAGLTRSPSGRVGGVRVRAAPRRDRRGQSDRIDATAGGPRSLSGERLARPRGGGIRDDLRLLLMERQGAVRPVQRR